MTKFGISGVREFSMRDDFIAQRSFRSEGEMILCRLAVDEESRAARSCRGCSRPRAVAFFADNKERSKIARTRGQKFLRRSDHRGDDALGLAGTRARDETPFLERT